MKFEGRAELQTDKMCGTVLMIDGAGVALLDTGWEQDKEYARLLALAWNRMESWEKMLAMLKKCEWAGARSNHLCPICVEFEDQGHLPDCPLAALIALSEREA